MSKDECGCAILVLLILVAILAKVGSLSTDAMKNKKEAAEKLKFMAMKEEMAKKTPPPKPSQPTKLGQDGEVLVEVPIPVETEKDKLRKRLKAIFDRNDPNWAEQIQTELVKYRAEESKSRIKPLLENSDPNWLEHLEIEMQRITTPLP